MRSFSTTASTIHPDVVKARVKSALEKRGKKGQARRQVVKGEASAKTRSRRNNKDTIASSTSAFWEGWGILDTLIAHFSELLIMGGKKDGAQLGRNLLKSKAQTKKGRRVAQQEGYLHTTDMQVWTTTLALLFLFYTNCISKDGYDWGRLNLQSVTEQDTYTG